MMYDKEKPEMQLDNAAEVGFCQFFERLPKVPEGTIRLFERLDFYSAHGPCAKYVAQHVYHTHSVIKYLGRKTKDGDQGLPSVRLSAVLARQFLRDALTAKQMRVEIYTSEGGKKTAFKLSRPASPVNLQAVEDVLVSDRELTASPTCMSVRLSSASSSKTVGVADTDASTREIGMTQFVDNDLFSNVASLVIPLGVKECLVQADEKRTDVELGKLRGVLDRCNVVITEPKMVEFHIKNVEQDLRRLVKDEVSTLAFRASPFLRSYLSPLTTYPPPNKPNPTSVLVRLLGIAEALQQHDREIALFTPYVDLIRELVASARVNTDEARPDFMRNKLRGLTTVLTEIDGFLVRIEKRNITCVSTESETVKLLDARLTSAVAAVQLSKSIRSLQSSRTVVVDAQTIHSGTLL